MPKKFKQKSLLIKPKSAASSNSLRSETPASQDGSSTKSVNDLIRESRQGTASEVSQLVPTASSVPPSLRAVLDMPIPPPPAPRRGISGPVRLRRIPGPPPPRSWLVDSIHAPSVVRDVQWSKAHERTRIQKQSSGLPGGQYSSDRSLQHAIMKAMATHWAWHTEYDHEYLAELPTKLKQTLLSYIAIYSEGQGPNPLRLLFPVDMSRIERDEVRRIDLGGAIGGWSTLKKIEKELEGEKIELIEPASRSTAYDIPDEWDVTDGTEQSILQIPSPVGGMRFRNLKHISLAVNPGTNGSIASWAGLLSLTSKLSTITSLSLAYWPQPTYTPNASTSMVKVRNTALSTMPSVTYGGTNYYSAFDNDWREAAGILRTLSRSLYCLNWLDLTGCGNWFSALVWKSTHEDDDDMVSGGPDWNGSWRGLEHLTLDVGWNPGPLPVEGNVSTIEPLPTIPADTSDFSGEDRRSHLLSQISSMRLGPRQITEVPLPESWNVEFEREKYNHRQEVLRFQDILKRAKDVAKQLRTLRKENGGKWINIDYGSNGEK